MRPLRKLNNLNNIDLKCKFALITSGRAVLRSAYLLHTPISGHGDKQNVAYVKATTTIMGYSGMETPSTNAHNFVEVEISRIYGVIFDAVETNPNVDSIHVTDLIFVASIRRESVKHRAPGGTPPLNIVKIRE